jgi:soluble lytic murein transglycosylase-like protein
VSGHRTASLLLVVALTPGALACVTPARVALVERYALGFGLDPDLLLALVWVESRFCPDARSTQGALGLGQLMPTTAAALGVDPEVAEENVWGAARYLRERYEEFGAWPLALAAYNAGPGAVRRYGGVPPFPETEHYVEEVLRVYGEFRARRAR